MLPCRLRTIHIEDEKEYMLMGPTVDTALMQVKYQK